MSRRQRFRGGKQRSLTVAPPCPMYLWRRGALGLQLAGAVEVFLELGGDLVGDVGAGAPEFRPEALLDGGPNHVAVLVHQAHGRDGFVATLIGMLALTEPRAHSHVCATR